MKLPARAVPARASAATSNGTLVLSFIDPPSPVTKGEPADRLARSMPARVIRLARRPAGGPPGSIRSDVRNRIGARRGGPFVKDGAACAASQGLPPLALDAGPFRANTDQPRVSSPRRGRRK